MIKLLLAFFLSFNFILLYGQQYKEYNIANSSPITTKKVHFPEIDINSAYIRDALIYLKGLNQLQIADYQQEATRMAKALNNYQNILSKVGVSNTIKDKVRKLALDLFVDSERHIEIKNKGTQFISSYLNNIEYSNNTDEMWNSFSLKEKINSKAVFAVVLCSVEKGSKGNIADIEELNSPKREINSYLMMQDKVIYNEFKKILKVKLGDIIIY